MNEMMNAGVEIMLIGMGIVFAFLAMLVVLVNFMTAVIQRFFPESSETIVTSPSTGQIDAGIIAAISTAVHQYRNKHH